MCAGWDDSEHAAVAEKQTADVCCLSPEAGVVFSLPKTLHDLQPVQAALQCAGN